MLSERDVEPPSATDPPPERPEPAVTVRAPALVRSELPIEVVAMSLPFWSVAMRLLVSPVSQVVPKVVRVEEAAAKVWSWLKVLAVEVEKAVVKTPVALL